MAPKRKRQAAAATLATAKPIPNKVTPVPLPVAPVPKRRASQRATAAKKPSEYAERNPETNAEIIDGPNATRASPDSRVNEKLAPALDANDGSDSPLSDIPEAKPAKKQKKAGRARSAKTKAIGTEVAPTVADKPPTKSTNINGVEGLGDPEAEGEEEAGEEELKQSLSRPPPVNSDYLPLPWKGRLGYACLNTYLRTSNPPVFSSRTCRIASILDHRHPLTDPSQPEHPTKNRPDKDQPADVALGQRWVESLGLANVRDIIKMVRWNERYGIKFMRLSSEMFPFASHEEYGYKLAPFAAETLAEAGKVIAELGHRVTTHPGQFTQLGSPRKVVVDNAKRDLEYHDEMLSLLKLPPQQNRDAVMILHMGGMFGDKEATLQRFRENYATLSQSIKNRLVLENDDMSWSTHDLLPVCQELNIPFVLDFHHHNIIFDSSKIREGTKDIVELFPQILETWKRKNITPKMHYSEPTPAAITPMQRRKHSPRVATLPPCPSTMDLMIEAKDKEQAVFELMRAFKLPGFEKFSDVIPYVRNDDNKAANAQRAKKKTPKKGKRAKADAEDDPLVEAAEELEDDTPKLVSEEDVGMGGPEGRVYWPPGMEEWLRPKKREVKKKDPSEAKATPAKRKKADVEAVEAIVNGAVEETTPAAKKKAGKKAPKAKKVKEEPVPTPESSDEEVLDYDEDSEGLDDCATVAGAYARRPSGMRKKAAAVNYREESVDGSE